MTGVQFFQSPIGVLRLIADGQALHSIMLLEKAQESLPNPLTKQAVSELEEYFSGKRESFDIAIQPHGTPFQLSVWSALSQVPYGKVVTYGQLAAAIGKPTACRAVANAVGKNPLLILLPCHRVVASNGLGGFSAGLSAKRRLLTLEGVEIAEKSAFSEKYFFTFP